MHVYKKGTETHTILFLNTFDHLGKDTVVYCGKYKGESSTGLALRELRSLVHHSRKLPNEGEKELYENLSSKFSFCIKKSRKLHIWN